MQRRVRLAANRFGVAASSLSSRDLQATLAIAGELAKCGDQEELTRHVRDLGDLVGADATIIGAVERTADGPPTIIAEDDPAGWFDAATEAAFARYWHQQPLIPSRFGQTVPRARKISDFLSRRQWQRREIYAESYRRAGLEWEIATQVQASRRHVRCLAVQRSGADFGERDRQLLDLIGPHLQAAYARLGEQAAVAGRIALLERGLERRGKARSCSTTTTVRWRSASRPRACSAPGSDRRRGIAPCPTHSPSG